MKRYKIQYRNKEYIYYAEDAPAAMEKFGERKVFGRPLIFGYRLDQYDADTQGKRWAKYWAGYHDLDHVAMVELAD